MAKSVGNRTTGELMVTPDAATVDMKAYGVHVNTKDSVISNEIFVAPLSKLYRNLALFPPSLLEG